MVWLRWVVFLLISFIRAIVSLEPLGFKNVTLAETEENVIFEWFQEDVMNKSHAMRFCDNLKSTIPNIRELQYFYKSLNLEANSIFYLQDVLETTTDSPRDDIGERLCITIKNSPGNPVKRIPFFYIFGTMCFALLIANCLWIVFCYKYCSLKRKQSNKRAKTASLFTGNGLKPISFNAERNNLGKYDLLPDVPLQRESYRKSQKSQKELKLATKEESAESLSATLGLNPKNTDNGTGFL
ncbi:unnamed protein product [Rodentolepis nana]|uniref:Uncharacterized protein n=1 Tax=Rodentolepis nana TaxID=102285 RepID=A0A0R3T3Q0_RODNA|nr:unnamed protein product [Rodentolepis nana]